METLAQAKEDTKVEVGEDQQQPELSEEAKAK